MAKSMTGYGRCRRMCNGRDITFEVKSVNNRFLDVSVKLPRMYNPLEERIKQHARKYTTRGKMDIYLSVDNIEGEKTELKINREYLEGFLEQLEDIGARYGVSGAPDINMIAQKSEIFIMKKADEDIEEIWSSILPVVTEAFEQYQLMRTAEGNKLKEDIIERIDRLNLIRENITALAPAAVAEINTRMQERIRTMLDGTAVDESRLLTECAVYADKSDITEELVRLGSHFSQLKELLEKEGFIGKTIDFLLQETNREVNTIGSKSNSTEIARQVVDAKSELEKIREQIQNIE